MNNDNEDEKLAQEAYNAYGDMTDHKNYRGEPMPVWEDLGVKIQAAWIHTVTHVRKLITHLETS